MALIFPAKDLASRNPVDIVIPTLERTSGEIVGKTGLLRSGLEDVSVIVVVDEGPQGFTKTVNRGITQSREEADVLILNDDVRGFRQDWLKDLQDGLYTRPRYGIAGPSGKSNTAPSCRGKPGMFGLFEVKQLPFWCVLIKREALKALGLLDERLVHYGSDNEYCFRALKAGWKCIWVRSVYLKHEHHGSGHKSHWAKRDHALLKEILK